MTLRPPSCRERTAGNSRQAQRHAATGGAAHSAEIEVRGWRGSGYTILNPDTGAQLHRVEGGFAGGLDIGCIIKAVVLTVICKNRFFDAVKRILQSLIVVVNTAFNGGDMLAAAGDALWAVGAAAALLAASIAFPILPAIMLTLSTVSYTHLTLPTNREV